MGTFPLLVSLDTRSTIDIDLPSCMSPSSDVFAVFLRILRCPVWHSMSHCHSVTVSRYAMPYHVMSWGLESIYCLSKRLQVFGLTASLLSVCYVLGKQDMNQLRPQVLILVNWNNAKSSSAMMMISSFWNRCPNGSIQVMPNNTEKGLQLFIISSRNIVIDTGIVKLLQLQIFIDSFFTLLL